MRMTVVAKAKVGTDFRMTIPKEVRDILELKEGEELIFYTVDEWMNRVCFRKARS